MRRISAAAAGLAGLVSLAWKTRSTGQCRPVIYKSTSLKKVNCASVEPQTLIEHHHGHDDRDDMRRRPRLLPDSETHALR